MSENKKINEELVDETLDTVAGGAGTPLSTMAVCSECQSMVLIQTTSFPVSRTCPRCGKYALFTAPDPSKAHLSKL